MIRQERLMPPSVLMADIAAPTWTATLLLLTLMSTGLVVVQQVGDDGGDVRLRVSAPADAAPSSRATLPETPYVLPSHRSTNTRHDCREHSSHDWGFNGRTLLDSLRKLCGCGAGPWSDVR